jgi:hypothetical protein
MALHNHEKDMNQQPVNPITPKISVDGLEHVFVDVIDSCLEECPAPVTGTPDQCLAPVPPVPTSAEGVPVEEAAKVLGLSINAVKKRLRKGSLSGYKVSGRYGDKWFVDRNELEGCPAPVTGTPDQCLALVTPVPTSAEGVPVGTDKHLEVIRELQSKLEALTYRNGYLESQLENHKDQIKLLTDSQHKGKWWQRLSDWFRSSG